jgi:putative MFS transporter
MSRSGPAQAATLGGITFHHPGAFWFGAICVTAGVLLHLPMYRMGRDIGYRLAGMPMDSPMIAGMAAIIIGLIASLYGLYPRLTHQPGTGHAPMQIKALDDAPLTRTHVGLLVAMAIAVTIDLMKPTALAFVMPGLTMEYGLKSPLNPGGTIPAAWIAFSGITGTVLGSFLWGWLGDRIGRRASILLAGIFFIATSICGAMPDFWWNVGMCFLMGLAVGGMLPICYALLAETIPARHRGWLMILIGADIAGAYVLTSWLAAALVPEYSWRILWLIGMPTGVVFILMNRWIPESPRFLLANGRAAEARAVMERYGARVVAGDSAVESREYAPARRWHDLVSGENLGRTLVVGCLGLGVGLVLFGFNLWIPTNLRRLGFTEADAILRNAALMGLPLTLGVAWLYGFWSSRRTIILLTSLTAAALLGFVVAGDAVAGNRALLYLLLIVPVWGISSVTAVLSVYSAEVYPTAIRSRGTGFAAGMSKFGGVAVIGIVIAGLATPSIATVALIGAIPMLLAVIAMVLFGVETTRQRLEDIAPAVVKAVQTG